MAFVKIDRIVCIISVCKKSVQRHHFLFYFPLRNIFLGNLVKGIWIQESDANAFLIQDEYVLKIRCLMFDKDTMILYGRALFSKNLKHIYSNL